MSRLHNYPVPDDRRSALVPHGSLDDLADQFGADKTLDEWEFGAELVEAISATGSENAYNSVAEYVVTQTEDMVTARHGHGGLSKSLIDTMVEYGFLTLRQLRGFKTPAAWLSYEIDNEVDSVTARDLIDLIEHTLGLGNVTKIDDWLVEEFFTRHLERTDGEPVIWHLASPEGAVSLLVPARRLNTHQLEFLIAEVATRQIDDLERFRKSVLTKGDLEQADAFEGQILDVRVFEQAILSLIDGGAKKGSGTIWQPDWSKGTRFNLAPLQRAGLLPFKVLSDVEMSELLASA